MLSSFPRAMLGQWPTPLEKLHNYGRWLGHSSLYMKRDDLSAFALGGNKVRNLEFQMGEAQEQQAYTVIAAGGVQSNQCRLAMAAARKLGLHAIAVHNAPRPPDPWQGNLLLNKLMGVETMFIGPVSESARRHRVEALADELASSGRRPYIVEQNARGALGYVNAAFELAEQAAELSTPLKHVVIVGAMGGTAAGFLFGMAVLDIGCKVHVISVEYDVPQLCGIVELLWEDIAELTGVTPKQNFASIATFYEDYLGPGYGISTPESVQVIYELAAREAIFAENVYNSKTLWGATDLIRRGVIPQDETVCIINTGGTPALFAQNAEF